MEELLRLYEDWRGCAPQSVELLPGAGSNRTYYRFWDAEGDSLIGVVGTSREENEAFIYLAGHFGQKRLPICKPIWGIAACSTRCRKAAKKADVTPLKRRNCCGGR